MIHLGGGGGCISVVVIQQFFCFEVFGEMLDRSITSAGIVSSAHAQFVKERKKPFNVTLLFSRAGFVRFNNRVYLQSIILKHRQYSEI